MRYNSDITYDRVVEVLEYSIVTGQCWWTSARGGRWAGKLAGTKNQEGRVQIEIDGKVYSASRIAWLLVTGKWPPAEVDHEDLDPSNNAWINLRDATRSQNRANTKRERRNTSGFKGVHWHAVMGRWCASIKKDGIVEKLGYFDLAEEAHAAYVKRSRELYAEFSRAA